MATGAYDIFTNLDLHYNALKKAVIDPVSTKPTDAPVGTLVYDTTGNSLWVCTSIAEEKSVWTELAQGGDVSTVTTRLGNIDTVLGYNSTTGVETSGGALQDIDTLQSGLGASTDDASASGTTAWSRIKNAEADIDTLEGKFSNSTAANNYYKVGVNSAGVVVSGSTTLAQSDVTGLSDALAGKAPLASPELTGTPTAPTAAVNTNTTQIATTAFVVSEISNKISAANALRFKGVVGTGTGMIPLPTTGVAVGDMYVIGTAGTYGGIACEKDDMIYATAATPTWAVVQGNIDGAVTGPASSVDAQVAVFNGTTGKIIKDSGFTIGKSVPADAVFTDTTYSAGTGLGLSGTEFSISNSGVSAAAYGDTTNQTPAYGGTFKVPSFTVNAQGQLTVAGEHTVTIPASDNTDELVKQTANSGETAIPILLAGTSTSGTAAEAKYASTVTVTPSSGTITATTFTGALSGNAGTATKLASAVNIGLSGVTATAQSFDGSQAITIPVTAVPANLVSGVLDETKVPYVGGYATVTVSTAGTAVSVTTANCDQVYTATLYDSTGKVCMADITLGSGSVSVNCSATGTYYLGWFGHRAAPSS